MKKVITYGTFDLLHYGHIRLLERVKELGDYLIVGITSNDFDKRRGKINVQQSLMERVKAIKETGLADEIIIEEYEGQKIDDICNYGIDIFAIGSDWMGKFDYLKDYCDVVYLERTQGISSTQLRNKNRELCIGAVGTIELIEKYINQIKFVNGLEITHIYTNDKINKEIIEKNNITIADSYEKLIENVEAIYISSHPEEHYSLIKKALENKKHVLFESPLALNKKDAEELFELAQEKEVILMEAIKTIYSNAYTRLMLLAKSGEIGQVVSIDATCTSRKQIERVGSDSIAKYQNSICAWGPTALLPIFQLFGVNYRKKEVISFFKKNNKHFDLFTKVNFEYNNTIASIKIGKGVKSEGELIITGTEGYIYVPAPWWKTDYFEIKYEDAEKNRRYFYRLDGEGIRDELITFAKRIKKTKIHNNDKKISIAIVELIEDFYNKKDLREIEF